MSDLACGKARCIANNPYAYGDPNAYVCGPHDRIRELEALIYEMRPWLARGTPPGVKERVRALLPEEGGDE